MITEEEISHQNNNIFDLSHPILHPAELRAPWEQEDHPDDHHADLVQHCLGRGGQILGHNHSCTESILLMKYYSMDSVFKDLHS